RESQRGGHLDDLRGDEQLAAVHAVGGDAAEQGEQQDRRIVEKNGQTEQEGIVGQLIDEPALGDLLNERAGGRGKRPRPHQPEIAVVESLEGAAEESLRRLGRNGYFGLLRRETHPAGRRLASA